MILDINQRMCLNELNWMLNDEGSSGNDIAIEMIEKMLRNNEVLRNE